MVLCPYCHREAMSYREYIRHNPFKRFRCRACRATLKIDAFTRFLCVVSFCVALGSFYFTFPMMHDVMEAQPNKVVGFLLDQLLPVVVITVQVVVVFVPAILYAWRWGKFEIVAVPQERNVRRAR